MRKHLGSPDFSRGNVTSATLMVPERGDDQEQNMKSATWSHVVAQGDHLGDQRKVVIGSKIKAITSGGFLLVAHGNQYFILSYQCVAYVFGLFSHHWKFF